VIATVKDNIIAFQLLLYRGRNSSAYDMYFATTLQMQLICEQTANSILLEWWVLFIITEDSF
jgi:hypothetical protein